MCNDNKIERELILQLKNEVEKLQKDTKATLLLQNGKIASLQNYIKDNLDVSLRKLLDSLEESGELTEIITDTLLYDLVDRIEKTNIFYDNISCIKTVYLLNTE